MRSDLIAFLHTLLFLAYIFARELDTFLSLLLKFVRCRRPHGFVL